MKLFLTVFVFVLISLGVIYNLSDSLESRNVSRNLLSTRMGNCHGYSGLYCEEMISYWDWGVSLSDNTLSDPFVSAKWSLSGSDLSGPTEYWGVNSTCYYGVFDGYRAIADNSHGSVGPDSGRHYGNVVSTKDQVSLSFWVYPEVVGNGSNWQMVIGNRFENSSMTRASGAGFVQGWNVYISTSKKFQSNGVPYSAIKLPLNQWSFWWSSQLDSKQGWNKMWLGEAEIAKWVHWAISMDTITGKVAIYKNGVLASTVSTANNDDGTGVFNVDGLGNPAYDAPYPNNGGDMAKFSVGGSSNPDFFPYDAFFYGRLAKMRMFNTELTPVQVHDLAHECEYA